MNGWLLADFHVPPPQTHPCTCGIMPVKETKKIMFGKIRDGGYSATLGRYVCPACGKAPGWGRCYCVDYGWDKSTEVWNEYIGG